MTEIPAKPAAREWWSETIPFLVEVLQARWSLSLGKRFADSGGLSWVAPARREDGTQLVLKLTWRHPEAAFEADALRRWNGEGAVLLHAAAEFADTLALLVERCIPGNTLSDLEEEDQDEVVTGLLRRLWVDPLPGHRFHPLQQMCDQWAGEFEQAMDSGMVSIDAGMAREGMSLFRSLPGTAAREVLLATDLHAGNVLASQREAWLAVDPKPFVGDPAFDVLQHMLNCEERLLADPPRLAERVANLAELDPGRVCLWLFARCVQESPKWPQLSEVARRVAPS